MSDFLPGLEPTPEQQLAARIWDRYRTDKRFTYVGFGLKLWKMGYKNHGQILEALNYLATLQDVRNPWAVVMSAPVLNGALARDADKRVAESVRADMQPQRVGDILGAVVRKVQQGAMDPAGCNADSSQDREKSA